MLIVFIYRYIFSNSWQVIRPFIPTSWVTVLSVKICTDCKDQMNCGHCFMCIFCIILKRTVCTYEAVYYYTIHFNINHVLHYTRWHTVRIFIILLFLSTCAILLPLINVQIVKKKISLVLLIFVSIPKSMFHYSSASSCSVK